MPTKRRPLKHGLRVGEVVVTERILDLYRAHQDEVREHGYFTVRSGQLGGELQLALGHLPWEDMERHDLDYYQLHLLSYPNPETRPKRLAKAVSWHNPLIDAYERELKEGSRQNNLQPKLQPKRREAFQAMLVKGLKS
jgi:hypothetical protein